MPGLKQRIKKLCKIGIYQNGVCFNEVLTELDKTIAEIKDIIKETGNLEMCSAYAHILSLLDDYATAKFITLDSKRGKK